MLATLWCTWPKKPQKKTKKNHAWDEQRGLFYQLTAACWHTAALSTSLPRATFLLYLTLLWIFSSWLAIQPLPKIKVNFKVSPRWYSAICLALFFFLFFCPNSIDWHTLGSGFPVMVLSSSWRCGQLPWEYHPGLSSDGSPSLSSVSFTRKWAEI